MAVAVEESQFARIDILNAELTVLQKRLLSKEVKTQLLLRSRKKTNQRAFSFPLLLQTDDPKGLFIPLWEAPAKW